MGERTPISTEEGSFQRLRARPRSRRLTAVVVTSREIRG